MIHTGLAHEINFTGSAVFHLIAVTGIVEFWITWTGGVVASAEAELRLVQYIGED